MGKLNFLDPVPADIEIAQSVTPTHIGEIAKQLNIQTADFEPHGITKAKVRVAGSFTSFS
jgi:formyltetrahydrofolate synthetase